ncbi:Integrator complex subunit 9 [Coemansia interrupta]|uniref:Integrator complex subunit 9 n=1 Tax=Coemansia interrupta TaxID=1126814 RepID=A0A9W8HSL5_9FUNG|nr:Integrator complex subunit 9 [Coemansia interrupta]
MFVVDCGWPADDDADDMHPDMGKQQPRTNYKLAQNPRDVLGTINWARVDFILISNYEQMRLLPYITEYTEFSGPVYTTEPTKVYGKCVLEESIQVAQGALYEDAAGSSSKMSSQRGLLYSPRDIVAAMEKITDVRHNEMISPVPFVQVYTRSSGYCIGAGNWTVEYKGHRTAFISTSTFVSCLHPQEWDSTVLREAQALVFCDAVDPAPSSTGSGEMGDEGSWQSAHVSQLLNQLCSTAISTLKQRGRVLLVGEPYGVTQDIVQLVSENIVALNLPQPQFVFVSPIAEHTLQYGNIMGEWLCESKHALLYLPEYPFSDKELRKKGHLHFVSSLADLATKSIPQGNWFVVVPPSDTETLNHFVRQWRQDAQRCSSADMASGAGLAKFSILIHDDDTARAQRLVNRLSVGTELTYVPVARRFTFHSIEQCLAAAERAHHVLVPSHVYARLEAKAGRYEFRMFEFSHLQATTVDLDTDRHLPLDIQSEMTRRVCEGGKQHALVEGKLSLSAGRIRLECRDEDAAPSEPTAETAKPKTEVGSQHKLGSADSANAPALTQRDLARWTPEKLADELNGVGLNASVIPASPGSRAVQVLVPGGSATIHLDNEWLVDCSSSNVNWTVLTSLRKVLKAA